MRIDSLWSSAAKLVVFAVVAVLLLVVIHNTMTSRPAGNAVEYRADFDSVAGLRVGDDVRAAGVRVGRVEAIELVHNDTARVTMSVSEQQPMRSTTGLVVRYQNLLGQRYLSMTPGRERGTLLARNAVVPTSRTSPGFDLTSLLNGFKPLFETLDPDQTNQLATSLVKVLQGEGGTVESLLSETATLTENLANKDKVIGEVVAHLTPVLENLAEHEQDFTDTVTELRALTTGLARQRTTIGESIDDVSALSTATADLVDRTSPDITRTVKALRRTVQMFASNMVLLQDMLKGVPKATGAFARPMSYGTWLNMYICNMGIEVAGNLVNIGPKNGPYSEACR